MKITQNPQKIYLLSLGCPRNLVDSELILSRLKLRNHRLVGIEEAQVVIVNTCGFIKEAKEESIDVLLDLIELKKKGKIKKIIAYGCLVERYAPELVSALKGVDAFVGRLSLNHTKREIYLTPRHYAYLKISEGCKNACSFCAIPKIKGKFVSRSQASLIEEVRAMERKGVVEINIIGQDTTLYGEDLAKKDNLVNLIKQILKNTKDIAWIRLLYLYPSHISDELLELIAGESRICKYIDLPLQHINNRILGLMNRKTRRKEILDLISKIRNKIPHVAIRSSLLVGFPTETDKEFNELLNFVEDIEFERLGVFIYSPEEGTPAFKIKPQVSSKIKQARLQTIMLKQQDISRQINKRFLGKTIKVLVDDRQGEDFLGRSPYDAPEVDGLVFLKSRQPLKIGEFKKVKVIDTLEYDLVGEVL